MARTIDGVSSIYQASRVICRLVGRFGTAALSQRTTPAFAAAVTALVAACQAFDALDNYPLEVDDTAPLGAEDRSRA